MKEFIDQLNKIALTRFGTMEVLGSSDKQDYSTPQDLFDKLDAEFHFDLDVCASDWNAKCKRYFTKKDNALVQEWTGNCWMNPPYGNVIPYWLERAYISSRKNETILVCLVPARTDTRWWWNFVIKGEIRFLKGRLKFERENLKEELWCAPFPSAVIILGKEIEPKTIWWKW